MLSLLPTPTAAAESANFKRQGMQLCDCAVVLSELRSASLLNDLSCGIIVSGSEAMPYASRYAECGGLCLYSQIVTPVCCAWFEMQQRDS